MLIIGHRGAAGLAPENTLKAMQAGHAAGAQMLECDVQLTRDNIPVVIHDKSLRRTHNIAKEIDSLTYEELRELTKNHPIPTLEQVCKRYFGTVALNIELKSPGSGAIVTTLLLQRFIKRDTDWQQLIISSFKARELLAVRSLAPSARIAILLGRSPFAFYLHFLQLQPQAVGFTRLYINRLTLFIAKRLGLFCYAYTINSRRTARRMERIGIDGIVTDFPDKMLQAD